MYAGTCTCTCSCKQCRISYILATVFNMNRQHYSITHTHTHIHTHTHKCASNIPWSDYMYMYMYTLNGRIWQQASYCPSVHTIHPWFLPTDWEQTCLIKTCLYIYLTCRYMYMYMHINYTCIKQVLIYKDNIKSQRSIQTCTCAVWTLPQSKMVHVKGWLTIIRTHTCTCYT